jgi:lipopolysaccharide export system permease protein
MAGPFLFGMGAFLIVITGIDILYRTLDLIMNNGLPAGPVLLAMAYRMPSLAVMTFPGAMIFATLMAFGELSGHGEVTAMRAGGIGLWRIALPTLFVALLVSLVSQGLYVWLAPLATARSAAILADLRKESKAEQDNLVINLPSKGVPNLIFYAQKFNPDANLLTGLLIFEFKNGAPVDTIEAASATWEGDTWVLHQARKQSPDGLLYLQTDRLVYKLGPAPWEIAASQQKPADMTHAQLARVLALPRSSDDQLRRMALEEWNFRIAVPWAALGLALIGLPLGIRPVRTSTGVGLGISLAVILAYYIAMSAMRILGQKENLPPMVADWLPNMLLYTTGLGLLINKSR